MGKSEEPIPEDTAPRLRVIVERSAPDPDRPHLGEVIERRFADVDRISAGCYASAEDLAARFRKDAERLKDLALMVWPPDLVIV